MAGVYLHGMAADYLAELMGQAGLYAGEILDVIPELMLALDRGEWPLQSPSLHQYFYQPL